MTITQTNAQLGQAAAQWVASAEGQQAIRESLTEAQDVTRQLARANVCDDTEWMRIPFIGRAIA